MTNQTKAEKFNKIFFEAKDQIMRVEALTIAVMEKRNITFHVPTLSAVWRLVHKAL